MLRGRTMLRQNSGWILPTLALFASCGCGHESQMHLGLKSLRDLPSLNSINAGFVISVHDNAEVCRQLSKEMISALYSHIAAERGGERQYESAITSPPPQYHIYLLPSHSPAVYITCDASLECVTLSNLSGDVQNIFIPPPDPSLVDKLESFCNRTNVEVMHVD